MYLSGFRNQSGTRLIWKIKFQCCFLAGIDLFSRIFHKTVQIHGTYICSRGIHKWFSIHSKGHILAQLQQCLCNCSPGQNLFRRFHIVIFLAEIHRNLIRDQIYILDFYFAWNGSSKRCILRLCLQIFEQFLHLCFAGWSMLQGNLFRNNLCQLIVYIKYKIVFFIFFFSTSGSHCEYHCHKEYDWNYFFSHLFPPMQYSWAGYEHQRLFPRPSQNVL